MSEMAHSEMAHEPTSNLCPSCAEAGIECIAPKKVPKITVSSLVKPGYRKDIPSEPFFFCQQKECGMVYFGGGGAAKSARISSRSACGKKRIRGKPPFVIASIFRPKTSWKMPAGIHRRPFLRSFETK